MSSLRQIEVFSAGCALCEETITLVQNLACPSCHVEVLDLQQPAVAERAKSYGISRAPAVVIDGQLASCCNQQGPDEAALRNAGLGQPRT